jgi:anthranilate/para-aminobenzoate synthase component II
LLIIFIKHNILRLLISHGCKVTVVPAQTTAQEVLKEKPDGVFLSNGPGDPEPCTYAIDREGFLRIRCLGCSEEVKTMFAKNLKDLLAIP